MIGKNTRRYWRNRVTRRVYLILVDDWLRAAGQVLGGEDGPTRLARRLVLVYHTQAAVRLAHQLEGDVRASVEVAECNEPEYAIDEALKAAGLRQVDWRQIADRLLWRFGAGPLQAELYQAEDTPAEERLPLPDCLYPLTPPPANTPLERMLDVLAEGQTPAAESAPEPPPETQQPRPKQREIGKW